MLFRILLLCLLGGFILPAMATQSHSNKALQSVEKKVIELERSMAILQVSTASSDDYQTLETQIEQLAATVKESSQATDRINFLTNLVFLLFVALLVSLFFQRRQARQLTRLLDVKQKEIAP
ncbi:hypothetical protein [Marinomonas arenicola]|uniref:Uncharacterized protein n=1 Tax=Marinomonas arenicola TaxID=569601 RepID=A0ABU9G6E0_9GAMM